MPPAAQYADRRFNQIVGGERLHLKNYHEIHCQYARQQLLILSLPGFIQSDIIIFSQAMR